jgi:histidyl-tRNA synthetase
MSNKPSPLQPIRGMKDLLPKEYKVHEFITQSAKKIGELYGYQQMSTSILEFTKIFDRTLGDSSDVVSKEMYSFLDRGGDSISLRPELTAGNIRAYISNSLSHQLPLKFFSCGSLFRYDRPQAGRTRQFHQLNFEHIGAEGAHTDAEIIKLALDILIGLKIEDVTLEINSLGCEESRKNYQAKLFEYFSSYESELSEDSKKRLVKNPLRILDSKDEGDKKITSGAPLLKSSYTTQAQNYFDQVLQHLDDLAVQYHINPKIVRGLDYYCHTAFEFTTTKLGSQNTVLGGGRYDGLAKIMGGPDTPAIGFAAGIERLALVREYDHDIMQSRGLVVMPIGDENISYCVKLADMFRQQGLQVIMDAKGKIAKRMQRALEGNASHVIFVGDEERKMGLCRLKDLDLHEEYILSVAEIIQKLKK